MRRMTLVMVLAAVAGSLLVAAPAAAGPVPPPAAGDLPVSSQPVFALPTWFSGTGTQSFDGSIAASGNFYSPTLGNGTYEYDIGPPAEGLPGGLYRGGTGTLTVGGSDQTYVLLCDGSPSARWCWWQYPGPNNNIFSQHHRTFSGIGRGGAFTEWGQLTKPPPQLGG
jgi:hypothetical protein